MARAKPVPPVMTPYAGRYPRKFLYESEVLRLIKAAYEETRNGTRNALMIWMMYRHGLRVSEACSLRWWEINMERGVIVVMRKKSGKLGIHEISPSERRFLTTLQRKAPTTGQVVFISELGKALSENAVYKMIKKAGELAGLDIPIHSHMLRHSCGYHLANLRVDTRRIQDWLGHCDIRHTVIYTELNEQCFDDMWEDALAEWLASPLK